MPVYLAAFAKYLHYLTFDQVISLGMSAKCAFCSETSEDVLPPFLEV